MSYQIECRICQENNPNLTCRLCRAMSIDHFLLYLGMKCETCRATWFNHLREWTVHRDRTVPDDHDCADHPRTRYEPEPAYRMEH